jgi:GNAT superfamily N-acetyltransferase
MTTFSPNESARFGLRIGRVAVEASTGDLVASLARAMVNEQLDVLIVRAPADDMSLPARLAALEGVRAVPADTLMYWEWTAAPDRPPIARVERVAPLDDAETVERLVSDVFPGYPNHYAANPLLSPAAALAGYCEWAASLLASGSSTFWVLESDDGDAIGFGLVDWSPEVPDVRLAGILPAFRGRGAYRTLISALMGEVAARGHERLRISTQAHNVRPMRTWAGLGWRPVRALTTVHLIREELLLDRDASDA